MKSKNGEGQSRWILALASTTLVLCLTGGCSRPPEKTAVKTQPPDSRGNCSTNPALWGPPEAFDLQVWSRDKVDVRFDYRVRDRYPAKKTIDSINTHLLKSGWTALKKDSFDPGTPGSRNRTWVQTNEPKGPDGRVVRGWMGDWQNKHGDFVRYTLIYVTTADKPDDLSEVVVSVQCFNSEQFKSMVDDAAKLFARPATRQPLPPP